MIFNLPDVGEGLVEAEIVRWYVNEGDDINAGEPLVAVETDKAVVDLPAPETGRIKRQFAKVGDLLKTGHPLAELNTAAAESSTGATVVGKIETADRRMVEKPSALSAVSRAGTQAKATPAVRALARKLDVDLLSVTPTGQEGTVTRADVQRVADRFRQYGPPEKLRGTRRAMATTMARAHTEVAPATLMDEADVEHWPPNADITCRLLRAIVAGVQTEPGINAWFDGHAMTRRVFENIDIALAMDTDDGLFTPVLRNLSQLDDQEVRATIEQFKHDVRSRTVTRQTLRDYTLTLSNYGTIAGRFAAPVVVPPTVAIVGAGRIYQGVVAVNGKPTVHRLLPLTLTFDHRAVTGGEAGRFLAAMMEHISADKSAH